MPDDWGVYCPACDWTGEPAVYAAGCPRCRSRGETQALFVRPPVDPPAQHVAQRGGIWEQWGAWLPRVPNRYRRTLGEGRSPLLKVDWLAERTGFDQVWLKMETANPTGSHKDRFHAVSAAVAASLGMRGLVSSSTGNHGLAMTVYARLHGMDALVAGNERMPALLQRAIRFAGGVPLLTPPGVAGEVVSALVETGDWFPATTFWPMPIANPYGVEGYKTIAWEIVEELDTPPEWILAPTAGGDLLTGIWLGLADFERAGVPTGAPRLCACQPAGAAPLVRAVESGLKAIPYLDDAHSIALSIADPTTGQQALSALRATDGTALAVTDEEILAMGALLARHGYLVEPSSAASVAALPHLAARYPEARNRPVVCIVTSSALKWLDDYGLSARPAGIPVSTVDDVWPALELG